MITFDYFKKLDIRIGRVVSAESVQKSNKLIKLILDLGSEQRQVIAGIAKAIEDTDELIGKEMPILVNLEPRNIMGFMSHGMILAAHADDGAPVLIHPAMDVSPGSAVG